jgi:hypothetical protein
LYNNKVLSAFNANKSIKMPTGNSIKSYKLSAFNKHILNIFLFFLFLLFPVLEHIQIQILKGCFYGLYFIVFRWDISY